MYFYLFNDMLIRLEWLLSFNLSPLSIIHIDLALVVKVCCSERCLTNFAAGLPGVGKATVGGSAASRFWLSGWYFRRTGFCGAWLWGTPITSWGKVWEINPSKQQKQRNERKRKQMGFKSPDLFGSVCQILGAWNKSGAWTSCFTAFLLQHTSSRFSLIRTGFKDLTLSGGQCLGVAVTMRLNRRLWDEMCTSWLWRNQELQGLRSTALQTQLPACSGAAMMD